MRIVDAKHKTELARRLVGWLADERERTGGWRLPAETVASVNELPFDALWPAFRVLVNTREPYAVPERVLAVQDELLQGLIAEEGIMHVADLVPVTANPRMRLWRGDITTLAADAIVNAANSGMTGCWQPLHGCIDNAIHTYAGVQLRLECARILAVQGHPEPTAQAKVTGAYNLPCRRIIHTVGPIAQGNPTPRHRRDLARCYTACLDAAMAEGLHSIAFCCISTGVFGFPQQQAAQIAVDTVRAWLEAHPAADMTVVFNVFTETDERIYRDLLT